MTTSTLLMVGGAGGASSATADARSAGPAEPSLTPQPMGQRGPAPAEDDRTQPAALPEPVEISSDPPTSDPPPATSGVGELTGLEWIELDRPARCIGIMWLGDYVTLVDESGRVVHQIPMTRRAEDAS